MIEKFHIPGVAGIIEKEESGVRKILIQNRAKKDAANESGLIEIPAGKIREFENIFDTLKREIREETGLIVTEVMGGDFSPAIERNGYRVIGGEPFYVSQNIGGTYPILVITFLCKVRGETVIRSNESDHIRWVCVEELAERLSRQPETFYPMHCAALRKYFRLFREGRLS